MVRRRLVINSIFGVPFLFAQAPPILPAQPRIPKPINGQCPVCGVMATKIQIPVKGCKEWHQTAGTKTAICEPANVKYGKPVAPDDAIQIGEVFARRCQHCSSVFIQDPE